MNGVEVAWWVLESATKQDGSALDPSQALVLVGIAKHAPNAWPSIATLAGYARLSERRVRAILRDLEAEGLLVIERRQGGPAERRADRRTNLYRVNCDESEGMPASPRDESEGMPMSGREPNEGKPASGRDAARGSGRPPRGDAGGHREGMPASAEQPIELPIEEITTASPSSEPAPWDAPARARDATGTEPPARRARARGQPRVSHSVKSDDQVRNSVAWDLARLRRDMKDVREQRTDVVARMVQAALAEHSEPVVMIALAGIDRDRWVTDDELQRRCRIEAAKADPEQQDRAAPDRERRGPPSSVRVETEPPGEPL